MDISSRETDSDGWRIYRDGETRYISVTTVLDYFVPQKLKNWFIKTNGEDVAKRKEETASKGSEIHDQAQQGTEDRLNRLMEEMGITPKDKEFVVSSKNGWAGTVDLTAYLDGKLYLIDIKTGQFGHAALQLAAYTLAHNEAGGGVEGNAVISLPRDPTQPAKWFEYSAHMEQNQYAWACAFDVFKHAYYKKLLEWPCFEIKTVFQYNWSFNHGEPK